MFYLITDNIKTGPYNSWRHWTKVTGHSSSFMTYNKGKYTVEKFDNLPCTVDGIDTTIKDSRITVLEIESLLNDGEVDATHDFDVIYDDEGKFIKADGCYYRNITSYKDLVPLVERKKHTVEKFKLCVNGREFDESLSLTKIYGKPFVKEIMSKLRVNDPQIYRKVRLLK